MAVSVLSSTSKMNKQTLSKREKILTSRHYDALKREGKRFSLPCLSITFRLGKSSLPKLGITVTKRFGKAHSRNRFKRVIREAFRFIKQELPETIEMNVYPKELPKNFNTAYALSELRLFAMHIQTPIPCNTSA